jgi:hypothetical protein
MLYLYYILGILVVIVAAALQSYCEYNRQARDDIKHKIFKTHFRFILDILWVILMLSGIALLFLLNWLLGLHWILGLIAIVVFWLVLPFIITPIIRNRLLPPWDAVKEELESKGYNERDYWRGDWWMIESKRKRQKRKTP